MQTEIIIFFNFHPVNFLLRFYRRVHYSISRAEQHMSCVQILNTYVFQERGQAVQWAV